MGFPVWTLWGMALTAVGALVTLLLAFLAQSPRLLKRLGLSGYRLDLRARTFTGYAVAFLVLSMGFFLAGVPLGPQAATPLAAAETPTPTATALPPSALVAGTVMPEGEPVATTISATAVATLESDTDEAESTDSTGAFGSGGGVATVGQTGETAVTPAPPTASDDAVEPTLSAGAAPEADAPAPTTATPTLVPSPTPTPSPTTTASPTPTLTPTAIAVESAVLDIGNSTLWLKRTPGGQDLSVLPGDTVLLIWPGRANMGGTLWREVSTLDGVVGWVEERYLAPDTAESQP